MAATYDDSMEEDGDEYKGYSVISAHKIAAASGGDGKYSRVPVMSDYSADGGLLQDVASCFFILTHSIFNKVTYLPFPVGNMVEAMEDAIYPLTHPLVEKLEGLTLRILAAVDNKIYAFDAAVEGLVLSASGRVELLLNLVQKRGVLGTTADMWVRHEASLSERTHVCIDMANKLPLLRWLTPLLCAITTPLLKAVSDWLVEHSQSVEKSIQYQQKQQQGAAAAEEEEEEEEEDVVVEKENWAATEKQQQEEPEEIKGTVDEATTMKGNEEERGKAAGAAVKGREEEMQEKQQRKRMLDTVSKQQQQGGGGEEEEMKGSNVLEMIESGWLLGSPTSTVTTHHPPPPHGHAAVGGSSSPTTTNRNVLKSAKSRWGV